MSDFDHLYVHLVDCDTTQPLLDFDTAKTIPKNSNRQRRVAVEAKADQRFAIDIYVVEGFDWAESNGLEVKLGFDVGEEVNCRSVYLQRFDKQSKGIDLPCLTKKDGFYHYRLDHILLQDPNGDVGDALRWQFYFRKLRADALANSHKGLPRTMDSQGKIRIEIARAVISPREYDKGIEADVIPAFRRHTIKTLLRKGITLEVLLSTDLATNRTRYKGNFRSDRLRRQNHQLNFDFVYREIGRHDSHVAAGDIVEVGGVTRSLSAVEAMDSVKSNDAPAKNPSTALVLLSPNSAAISSRNETITALHTTTNFGSFKIDNIANPPLPKYTRLVPIAENSQNDTMVDSTTSDESMARESVSASSSRSHSETDNSSCTALTALASRASIFNHQSGSDGVSSLMEAENQRQTAEANELRILLNQLADVEQRQRSNEERSRNLHTELEIVNAESYALEKTRKELEKQQHQIVLSSDESTRKVRQAWEKFRDAMKEIEKHSIELANTRKRKRSEDV